MPMLNDCNFIGRCGKQPSLQKAADERPFLRFSLAIDQGKDKQGNEKEPMWLTIVCFGKLAELMAEMLTQGAQLFVKGRLQKSTYTDREGVKRESVAIEALDIQVFEKRQAESAGSQEGSP